MNKRYKPKLDRLFAIIAIPTLVACIAIIILPALSYSKSLFITVPTALFVIYFLISPLFGYAELRENELFIKYGFFLKKAIPYSKIRSAEKQRKYYSDSMLSLKNAFEHVNIKYNSFDATVVSVEDNDEFVANLCARLGGQRAS